MVVETAGSTGNLEAKDSLRQTPGCEKHAIQRDHFFNKLAERTLLLAHTLLIYNKLLSYECTWILENNLFSLPVLHNVISYTAIGEHTVFLNHSLKEK